MSKPVRLPGSEHPITIAPAEGCVIVNADGRVVANTRRALTVREANYAAVYYIPPADADMSLLTRTDHSTYCPYKGDASYFSLPNAANAAWSYENPHAAMAQIKGYLAFYPDRVDSIEQSD